MRNEVISGRYRILERLGEGGMAVVYTARDEKLGRVVAIKLLHQHFSANQDIRQRFEHEARSISVLDHPNIVKVFDYSGPDSEQLWIVTELLKGQNLSNFVRGFEGSRLHPVIAACIVREICRALEHAHSREIVHRDIKPENVMVLDAGPVSIKLMDFGIAKNLHSNSLTQTGTFMGSPSYMSPEQVRGRGVDHRADIYSLGVVLYEIVVGRLPFLGNTTHDVVLKIVEGQFPKPSSLIPELPRDLDKLICKAMNADPERRFQTSKALGREIDLFLTRSGFVESHVELERYFTDRNSYDEKLRRLNLALVETRHRLTQRTQNPPSPEGDAHRTIAGKPPGSAFQTQMGNFNQTQKLSHHTRQHNDAALVHPQHESISAEMSEMRSSRSGGVRRDRSIPPQFLPSQVRRTMTRKEMMPQIPKDQLRQSQKIAPPQNAMRASAPAKRRRVIPKIPKRSVHHREIIVVRTAYRPPESGIFGWMLIAIAIAGLIGGVIYWGGDPKNNLKMPDEMRDFSKSIQKEIDQQVEKLNSDSPVTAITTEKPKVQPVKPEARIEPKAKDSSRKSQTSQVRAKTDAPAPRVASRKAKKNNSATANSASRSESSRPAPAEISAQPRSNQAAAATSKPIRTNAEPGRIVIRDTPPALIFVNNKLRCRIPCESQALTFAPGTYDLRAERTGFEPSKQTVNIVAGEALTVRFAMLPIAKMKLVFDWDISMTEIRVLDSSGSTISRKRFGISSDTIELPAGDYVLELRQGSVSRQIRVANPGGGNTRFVADPFGGGGG
jgi:serine/threonine protein kinase